MKKENFIIQTDAYKVSHHKMIDMGEDVEAVLHKGYINYVKRFMIKDLDKTKLSYKFVQHDLPQDTVVYVKCTIDGDILYRGKKQQYRLIPIKTN